MFCVSPFALATPPRFQVNISRRGTLYFEVCMRSVYGMHFFCTSARFSLLAAGLFSLSRLRGTQGARVYAGRKFAPRPGSMVRDLGAQIRALYPPRGASQDNGNPTF